MPLTEKKRYAIAAVIGFGFISVTVLILFILSGRDVE